MDLNIYCIIIIYSQNDQSRQKAKVVKQTDFIDNDSLNDYS